MEASTPLLKKLGETLREAVRVERQGDYLLIPAWGLRVAVGECRVDYQHGLTRIHSSIMAYHPRLPGGFVRELSVGSGPDLETAIGNGLIGWTYLLFPTLQFVFDEHPHDCLVNLVDVQLPSDPGKRYKLIEGPVQALGFADHGQGGPDHSALWNALATALLPSLAPGVHHLRCFACRTDQSASADVFVDGAEWPDGSERLRSMARAFPKPNQAVPVYWLKQHLILRPVDLTDYADRQRQQQVDKWQQAVAVPADSALKELVLPVLDATYVLSRCRSLSDAECRGLLKAQGQPSELATALALFLPSIAAQVLMRGKVQFAKEYLWANSATMKAVRRRYDQTPVCVAALHVYTQLIRQGLASKELLAIAEKSAEMSAISQLVQKGDKLEGIHMTEALVLTAEPVEGEDLDVLRQRRAGGLGRQNPAPADKPWWKFW